MTTGERIREVRKERGLTQEELGKMIGVQKAAINKYETGIVVNLKRSTVSAIARALDVSPIYLLGLDEQSDPIDLSSDEYLLISTFRSLSDHGKQLMMDRAVELSVLYGGKSIPSENIG